MVATERNTIAQTPSTAASSVPFPSLRISQNLMRGSIVLRLLGEYQAAIHLRMGNAKPRIEPAARLAPINGVEIRLIIRIGVALRDLVASVGLFV
jgi:hypothetical protein